MRIAQHFQKHVIDSQLYVSLMGTLFASFFILEQGTFRFPTFFLLLLTYFSGYLYTEYQYSTKIFKILLFNALLAFFCIVLIIQNHNIERLYKLAIICFLGLLYNSFFLKINIRKIPLLKVFYVGFIWGLMNAWLSFEEFNLPIFLISFLFVTALVLPFDIRDMERDKPFVVTFPHIIGVRNTKILAYIFVVSAWMLAYLYLEQSFFIAFSFTSIITLALIYFTKHERTDFYFSFWVESCSGLPLLFWLMTFIYPS
ncbi:MAG TPA: hypothetical protein PLP27_10760 [Crocinitomicaceae bacterium]|nr:hypothetical protein [Crocinitomicaceae bacterium]